MSEIFSKKTGVIGRAVTLLVLQDQSAELCEICGKIRGIGAQSVGQALGRWPRGCLSRLGRPCPPLRAAAWVYRSRLLPRLLPEMLGQFRGLEFEFLRICPPQFFEDEDFPFQGGQFTKVRKWHQAPIRLESHESE